MSKNTKLFCFVPKILQNVRTGRTGHVRAKANSIPQTLPHLDGRGRHSGYGENARLSTGIDVARSWISDTYTLFEMYFVVKKIRIIRRPKRLTRRFSGNVFLNRKKRRLRFSHVRGGPKVSSRFLITRTTCLRKIGRRPHIPRRRS